MPYKQVNIPPLAHTESQEDVLVKAFSELEEIQAFINWIPVLHKSGQKWLKKPIQLINIKSQHMLLRAALAKSGMVGLVCDDTHPVIALDIDGVENTHPQLQLFLEEHPTYQEFSPSGKLGRTRLLYRLFESKDKWRLKSKSKVVPEGQSEEIELYNYSKNYVTLTGQICSEEKEIQFISIEDLLIHWPEFKAKPKKVVSIRGNAKQKMSAKLDPSDIKSLIGIKVWLKTVPCDRDSRQTQKYMANHGYTYYEYWLLGLMALHYTFGEIEGFIYADTWSASSSDYNKEELEDKWRSLSNDDSYASITERTYQAMFQECTITWPVVNMSAKGKATKTPVKAELVNFKAWLDYCGLKIAIDDITKGLFLRGEDTAIIPHYYKSKRHFYKISNSDIERLSSRMTETTSEIGFRPSDLVIQTHIRTIANGIDESEHVNRFAKEISKHVWDGEDRISIISKDIIQKHPHWEKPTQAFQDILVRKWLLSLARHFWPDELHKPSFRKSSSEGLLLLSGKQGGINKSSFGVRLFPEEWQHLHVSVKPRLSGISEDKDYKMKVCTRIIVDYDEAERIIGTNSDADMKNEITATEDLFRMPFGKSVKTYKRKYSHLASTNKTALPLPKEGARRVWWLNVSYVDTYALDDLDKYQIWAQIKHELKKPTKRAPWLLTSEETSELLSYLNTHRSGTSLQIQLEEIFAFDDENYIGGQMPFGKYKSNLAQMRGETYTITEIARELGHPSNAALKHAIEDFLDMRAPDSVRIGNYKIIDGIFKYNGRHRYFMPPLRNESWGDIDNNK